MKSIKSRKILQNAREQECTMHVTDVCNYNPETTVAAHINVDGGKMGGKTHDFMSGYICSDCHNWLDNHRGTEEDRLFYKIRALQRTWEICIRDGIIVIK